MAGFGQQVRRFRARSGQRAERFVREVTLEFLRLVVTASPVDTGRYKANHQVMLHGMTGREMLAFDKDGSATIARGAEVIARYRPGDTILVGNATGYAYAVEFQRRGDQAAAGVYRVSWQRLLSWVQRNGPGGGL